MPTPDDAQQADEVLLALARDEHSRATDAAKVLEERIFALATLSAAVLGAGLKFSGPLWLRLPAVVLAGFAVASAVPAGWWRNPYAINVGQVTLIATGNSKAVSVRAALDEYQWGLARARIVVRDKRLWMHVCLLFLVSAVILIGASTLVEDSSDSGKARPSCQSGTCSPSPTLPAHPATPSTP